MKKIITSLGVLAVVAAAVIGATVAFFNDTETSTGNTFTAGGIDLTVDSLGAKYNGQFVSDSSWFAEDLVARKFFSFADVKPGDVMSRNISLHVENNPAWVCLIAKNTHDNENTLTDPEQEDNDNTPGPQGQGELAKNLDVVVWRDSNPNGVHEQNEPFLVDSFFDVLSPVPVRDSTTGTGPLLPTIPTEMLQMDICGGNHVIGPPIGTGFGGAVSCNGGIMGNTAQTDSLTADLALYITQERNNPNFKCADLGQPN